MTGWGEDLLNELAELEQLKKENEKLKKNLKSIKEILDFNKKHRKDVNLFDAAKIYSECVDALGEDE